MKFMLKINVPPNDEVQAPCCARIPLEEMGREGFQDRTRAAKKPGIHLAPDLAGSQQVHSLFQLGPEIRLEMLQSRMVV